MQEIMILVVQLLEFVFKLGAGAVSWCSKRQPTMSLSTTEAGYRAAAVAAQESTWLMLLMKDLKQLVGYAVSLFCDNQSAISLAENPVFQARTKHVEIHYHFIREKVLQGEINSKHIKTRTTNCRLVHKRLMCQ
ncbi:hypothetical protein MTR67_023742 [Solanum verrucosum]|uniref:Uncharacterized protein n=1 Tax=Solanum verrucosum TaxID=315347 RepID=A0AAF0QU41_SOLVR|nr:hypothetical protein MTR67_023742 [Solanum verrucosum]